MEHLPPGKQEVTVRPASSLSDNRLGYPPQAEPTYHDVSEPVPRGGLLAYWLSLRRHKGAVILFSFLGLGVAVLYTLRQTPIYQAHASIEVLDLNLDFLSSRPINAGGDDSNYAALSDIPTQIKLLQSQSLATRVVDKLSASRPATAEGTSNRVSGWRAIFRFRPAPISEVTRPRDVRIRASGQTRVIEVYADSESPQYAADYANTLTSEFIDSNVEARWKMSQRTGEWLSRQLDDLRVKLERSEDNLQNYANRAKLMFTSEKNSVSEERMKQLQAELSKVQAERFAAQSKFEMIKSAQPDSLPEVMGDTSLHDIQGKLLELRRQEAELLITFKPKHEKVRQVQTQIEPLEAALEMQRGIILERIQNDFETVRRRERLLSDEYVAQSQVVSGEAGKSIQYGILKREVDSNRSLYDSMLQKVKETGVTSAMRASNVRVVDPAEVPSRPYKPDTTQNGGIGLLAGLCVGICFVLMRERADHTLQEPGDSQFWLNIPELGIIPRAEAGVARRVSYGKRQIVEGSANGNSVGPKRTDEVELTMWQNKPSMLAECFRSALVSILFSGENGSRPRVIVITSSGPTEGKSTVVSNLGIAMAEVHQKVLVIDADLRKPRMHHIFGLKNDRGLKDLLVSKAPISSLLAEVIQETDVPDLYVLTSGSGNEAATSLLYSSRMPEVLKILRTQFEAILIDTPPMLQIPDARVLGRIVDRVIMVVRAGKTTRDAAMAARQKFSEDGTLVMGTILNDWDPKWSPGGYYGYDNKYYRGHYGGYGYGSEKSSG